MFKGYAKHRIKGAILDSLREMDWASRDLRRRHKRLEEVTRELSAVMERNPTELEIAEKMGMDLERWRQVALELRMVGFLSASTRMVDHEEGPAPEFPAAPDSNPGVMAGQRQLESMLANAMNALPVRYQEVIRHYYNGGKTMREIGESMGVNESRVSQIHKAALERMAEDLRALGNPLPGIADLNLILVSRCAGRFFSCCSALPCARSNRAPRSQPARQSCNRV